MILSEEIEAYRDRKWRRDPERRIEDVYEAEIRRGSRFCAALTDSRRPGPSCMLQSVGEETLIPAKCAEGPRKQVVAWTLGSNATWEIVLREAAT
jgi:hypothetical protein